MFQSRKYLRHPSNIGIEYHIGNMVTEGSDEHLTNISLGGLAFISHHFVAQDSLIDIIIPLVKPVYHFVGKVRWCRGEEGNFEVGVEFIKQEDKFKTRMIEQVCEIESYKQEVLEKEGRDISSEDAAMEWIGKFGAKYPKMEDIK